MVESKCNKDIFERERTKNIEKMNFIYENVADKADKGEIKKALMFLEDKIKDIILLVANSKE